MLINFHRLMRVYLVLFLLGALAYGFALMSLRKQWALEQDQTIEIARRAISEKADQLQNNFAQIYQNLRLIALLPGIRGFAGPNQPATTEEKYNPKYFTPEVNETVQQIYNNLASNVAISEVYGVLQGFDPARGEKPFFMLDELILQNEGRAGEAGDDEAASSTTCSTSTRGAASSSPASPATSTASSRSPTRPSPTGASWPDRKSVV